MTHGAKPGGRRVCDSGDRRESGDAGSEAEEGGGR